MKNRLLLTAFTMTLIVLMVVVNYSLEKNMVIRDWKKSDLDEDKTLNDELLKNHPLLGVNYIIDNTRIFIDDNGDFLSQGFTGNGDINNPYVLENRSITNNTGTLIHIQDTTAYFKIFNCSLNALGSNNIGIYFESVSNGVVTNNTINDCSGTGIDINFSNNNTLLNNTINDCSGTGIDVFLSPNTTVTNNTVKKCSDGIYIRGGSPNSTVTNNTISSCSGTGIYLYHTSPNTNVSGNTINSCSGTGIINLYSNNNTLSNNTIIKCSPNGIFLCGYYNTLSGNTINTCSDEGIYLGIGNHNNILSNTIVSASDSGIFIEAAYNTLSGNTIDSCSDEGIGLYWGGDNNTLSNNTISNCHWNGINIYWGASNNTLSGNTLFHNNHYGIAISGDNSINNIIKKNDFIYNHVGGEPFSQAYDEGINNSFCYNYWNEWTTPDISPPICIVDFHYLINGSANNNDSFPVTTLYSNSIMLVIITPITQIYGTDTITVMLDGYNVKDYWYYIETVDNQNQTWTGSVDRLIDTDGTYILHAYGNNTLGITTHVSVMFTINVVLPTVNIISPTNTTYNQDSVILTYTISGVTVTTVTIYINDVISTTVTNGSTISGLSDRSYNITIVAMDQARNIGKDTVIFTIDTTISPSSSSNEETTETTNSISPGWTYPLLGIVGICFIILRKKRLRK